MNRDMGDTQMIGRDEAKTLIRELFEEEALVIGGLVAVREMEDDREHSQFVTHCKASIGAAQASCASSFQRWAL